jgi:hypothetical protein
MVVMRTVRNLVVAAVALTLAGVAGAEETPQAALQDARKIFEEARKDEQASRWGDAFVKFKRVAETAETASVIYHMGYCQEKMGLLASAYRDYERASALAQATKGRDWQLIVDESAEQLRALLPRVPVVVIKLPKGHDGAKVKLDETALRAPFEAALRVDPGHHDLVVTADGYESFQESFTLAERQSRTVQVTLRARPAPAPAVAPTPPQPSLAAGAGQGETKVDSSGDSRRQWALATGVTSFVLASVATAFYVSGRKATGDIDDFCARDFCDRDSLEKTRNLNYVFAGVTGGAALVGGGAALWLALSAPSKTASSKGASWSITPGGFGLAGRF